MKKETTYKISKWVKKYEEACWSQIRDHLGEDAADAVYMMTGGIETKKRTQITYDEINKFVLEEDEWGGTTEELIKFLIEEDVIE